MSVDQHRSVIDHKHFEEDIRRHHKQIESAKNEDTEIDLFEVFSPHPLAQPEQCKTHCSADRRQSQPVRNRIQGHMHACQVMNPAIHRCKSNRRSLRSNRLNVNKLNCCRPYYERSKQDRRNTKILFRFFFQFRLTFLLCSRFYQTTLYGKGRKLTRNGVSHP